ncbi:hypothetical protein B7Z17_00705 [Candidatus Saccharibacteria bacterium 32-49-10]|nr:MAG: hypothetical protein B7Z17_00705 [Candidatus Saccharibacteria bacterium 32-49-10]
MRHIKRFAIAVSVFVLVVSNATPAFAEETDFDFYSSNDILYYDKNAVSCLTMSASGTSVTGDGNIAKMWNYLVGKGLTNQQAAGILGNIQVESGFSPFRQEDSQSWPSGGYGIVQWTGSRRTQIVDKMREGMSDVFSQYYVPQYGKATKSSNGYVPDGVDVTVNDKFLAFELDFLYQESTTRKVRSGVGPAGMTEWQAINNATSIRQASDIWLRSFERPANQSDAHAALRAGFGQKIYDEMMKSGATTTTPVATAPSTETSTLVSTISATSKGTIFIDPGHGGAISPYIDEKTGLKTSENYNTPETEQMLIVANRVKTELEKVGYTVVLSRTTNTQQIKFRTKAEAAIAAKAVLGVSLHSDKDVNQGWAQRVGAYRQYGDRKAVFSNTATAEKSAKYNAAIIKARAAVEGRSVGDDASGTQQTASFGRDGIFSKGNIPLISLFADTVPWSYNEFAHGSTKLSEKQLQQYTDGIVKGIQDANPSGTGVDNDPTTGGCGDFETTFSGGDLSATTLAYAWPTYHKKPYTKSMPAYVKAVAEAQKLGEYVGATIAYCRSIKGVTVENDGADCGGFVTRLVTDSGWDPTYNHSGKGGPTPTQKAWLDNNWENLGRGNVIDTGTLRPGDVAMLPGHTFIYVGDIPGFGSKIASASLCQRAPMAGSESITASNTTWYRKKG